jgi:hypothetical protein
MGSWREQGDHRSYLGRQEKGAGDTDHVFAASNLKSLSPAAGRVLGVRQEWSALMETMSRVSIQPAGRLLM